MEDVNRYKPDICIGLPTLNRSGIAFNTIVDALKQSHKNIEIVVADQTLEYSSVVDKIKKLNDKRLRYFVIDPPSLPAARNFILENSKADLVLFIDDDVRLDKDLVKEHLLAHRSNTRLGAVAGRVMQEGFPIKKEVLRFNKYAIPSGVFTATDAAFTNSFPGGNHSIKRELALKLGGYDTRYVKNSFREESDMAYRLIKSGHEIYYNPKASLLHLAIGHGGTRIKQSDMLDNPIFYHNELFFTLKATELKDYPFALLRKFKIYCVLAPGKIRKVRRSLYFCAGLIVSWCRVIFLRQIKTKVIYSLEKNENSN